MLYTPNGVQVADPSPLTVGNTAYLAYDGDNNGCHDCSHAAIGLAVAPVARIVPPASVASEWMAIDDDS